MEWLVERYGVLFWLSLCDSPDRSVRLAVVHFVGWFRGGGAVLLPGGRPYASPLQLKITLETE